MVVAIMAILYILQKYVNGVLDNLDFIITCPGTKDGVVKDMSMCLGVSAVYRVSLALAIMHFLILFACSFRNQLSKDINEEAWCCKFILIILATIGLLYVDNSFFITYANIAKIVSGFFLMFQIIMIIDLCYLWGEKWVAIYDDSNGENYCWMVVMIIMSIILYIGTGYLMVKNYGWYTGDNCGS